MAGNGRAKATRNMLTESFPKDVHTYRPNVAGNSVPAPGDENKAKELRSTEYRHAFGSENKLDEGEGGLATELSLTHSVGRTSPRTTQHRHASTKHLLHTNLSNTDLKTDWTTSYMRDFKRPITAIGLIIGGDELLPEAEPVTEETLPPSPEEAPQSLPLETTAPPPAVVPIPIELKTRKAEAHKGESMKTLLRHTNYLPNPISEERRCFDDDENHNPTLKKYIDSIARK